MAVTVLSPSAFALASLARSDEASLSWPLPVGFGAPTVLPTWLPDVDFPVAADAAPGTVAAAPLVSSAAAARAASVVRPPLQRGSVVKSNPSGCRACTGHGDARL